MHAVSASADAVSALRADARVSSVELDRSRAAEAAPNDTAYSNQWALPKIGWDQVFGTSIGGSATVAILDTGVDGSQPELAGKLVAGTSLLGTSATTDPNGHGTAMAGIVAAGTNNGSGIAGVGYAGVKVMPVTVLNSDGLGRDSDIIEGLVWAADHGADVALMAFSASGYSIALQAAVDYAWSKGVVLVAATGNDGVSSAAFPAGDRGVVGVSNTDQSDTLNASSNYGADTFLAAPGTDIVTIVPGGGTTSITGTSASAAHVAAAAALLRAADGSLSNGVIVGRLARTADAAGTVAQTGNGRLNLARAFSDNSTGSVKPEGAAPVGDGGPFVGPYLAAGNTDIDGTVKSSAVGNPGISGASVDCTAGCTGTATTALLGTYSVKLNYPGTSATVTLTASKAGFTSQSITRAVSNNVDEVFNFILSPSNSAPVVTNVVIAPASPTTNETITATPTATDADGDTVTFTYQWQKKIGAGSFTNISGATSASLDLSVAGNGDKGDELRVLVTPNDGTVNGAQFTSSAVTVANSAPVVTVLLTPANPTTNAVLTALTTSSDADGDAVALTYVWKVNGTTVVGATSSTFNLAVAGDKGDVVRVEVTPNDGTVNGLTADHSVTVANSAPVVTNVVIAPASPTTNETITATPTATDADGDTVTFTYQWQKKIGAGSFTNISGATSASLDLSVAGNGDKGDELRVLVTPNDGTVNGAQFTSSAVTVANSAPVVTVLLTPANPTTNAVLTALTTSSDADGDAVALTYVWKVNGTTVVGATSSTFNLAVAGDKGDVVRVEVTPNDGTVNGLTADHSVTVANSAPVVTNVVIAPASPTTNETITATPTATDADGDTVTFTYQWQKKIGAGSFTNISGATSASLDLSVAGNGDKGDELRVLVTPNDGTVNGAQFTSSAVTVANSAPELTLSNLNDVSVGEGSAVIYHFSVIDADGDTFVVSAACGTAGDLQTGSTDVTDPSDGTFTCNWGDGDADGTPSQVTAYATDSDGAVGPGDMQEVAVNNVAPTVILAAGNTYTFAESATAERTFGYTASDPAGAADPLTITIDCGTGGSYVAGSDTGSSFKCLFTDGPASPIVSVSADDGDLGFGSASNGVAVNNVAPTVILAAGNTYTFAESATAERTFGYTASDPAGAADPLTITIDCGTGGRYVAGSDTGSSFKCLFTDGPASPIVSVSADDGDLGFGSASNGVAVDNVARRSSWPPATPTPSPSRRPLSGRSATPPAIRPARPTR